MSYAYIQHIIPEDRWNDVGSWEGTLDVGLQAIEELDCQPGQVTISTATTVTWILNKNKVLGRLDSWSKTKKPLPNFPQFSWRWDTTDGKSLDLLVFEGPYSRDNVVRIVSALVDGGLKLTDRWSLVITFSE
jgi:hypothetical protein